MEKQKAEVRKFQIHKFMRSRPFLVLALILLGAPLYFFNSCGQVTYQLQGTSTTVGNPGTASATVMYAVCGVLDRCSTDLTVGQCEDGVLALDGLDQKMGLSPASYNSLESIREAEQVGTLSSNKAAAESCFSTINSLDCNDPVVQNAYDPSRSTPFSGVENMFLPGSSCEDIFVAPISNWSFVDGGTATGINQNINRDADRPEFAEFNSKIYGIWNEKHASSNVNQVRVRVYNGNDLSPSWSSVDGGNANGLNFDSSKEARWTHLATFDSKLYATWSEDNGGGAYNVHVAAYNGNDSAPVWSLVDGSGATGVNLDTALTAYWSRLQIFNSKLYLVRSDTNSMNPGSATISKIRVSVYNGNDSSPAWGTVDSGGLNINLTATAYEPHAIVYNSKLYVTWQEWNSSQTANQIRVKVFNGDDNSPNWISLTGVNGLNKNTSNANAQVAKFAIFNSLLYVTWQEKNTAQVNQIRVAAYNGSDSSPLWSLVDGGGEAGLNHDSTQGAHEPKLAVVDTRLYAIWSEYLGSRMQIRVRVFNGNNLDPQWTFADGNTTAGLNYDSNQIGYAPQFLVSNSKLFAFWREASSLATNIRAAVGSP